ncbi:metallo-beta-lactamase [Roseivivax halodurans JCM 10272]|uniref:Metallo-beta-lactamase n=1 Tax=Roseivivax halodurans JCM 10272 TaxID=1449350 RepID=X7EK19_9RHOB|nr:MBL fold metallo-hydrolase [Roseivivax halodurans]ETX15521.1 metallo-beta-lactamase [Roseivivax halodurans JCM 10272]
MQDPDPNFRPVPGRPEPLGPGLRRVLAPNPSPMTFRGTNTYLVGTRDVAVIDPGPSDMTHLAAILSAVGAGRVTAILVTHAHLDHSPLARPLGEATGAPVLAYGGPEAGRSAAMRHLASSGELGGGEGVDRTFRPDETLADGDVVTGEGWSLRALHTPGHFGNHLSFAWDDILFTGDLVMGWASSLVSPPDGDLTDFMASLDRISRSEWSVLYPGHGAPVAAPAARVSALLTHRRARETAILAALADGPATPALLAARLYTETPRHLLPAAERNVLAHLVDLSSRALVAPAGALSAASEFGLT